MRFSPRLLNILGAASFMSGSGLFAIQTMVQADLTGQGSTVIDHTTGLHPAAAVHAGAGMQLIAGISLIVLAFFLHALAKSRNGERPVHITVKPKKKQKTWFWIEMRI